MAVVEADPCGGDLAVRFQLTTLCGWSSYAAASRRSVASTPVDPHLQALPGGLAVLVGARAEERMVSGPLVEALLESSTGTGPGTLDLMVDCGRLLFDDDGSHADRASGRVLSAHGVGAWLDHSDLVVVVTRRDPPSILKVRERAPLLTERCGERLRLVVVGRGPHDNAAIQEFTGIPVIGEVPFDIVAGQIASGGDGSSRHLSHSLLVVAARRLAEVLATPGGLAEGEERGSGHDRNGTRPDPSAPTTNPAKPTAKTSGSLRSRIARFARADGLARSRRSGRSGRSGRSARSARSGRSGRSARRGGGEATESPLPAGTLSAPQPTPRVGLDPDHAEQGALR